MASSRQDAAHRKDPDSKDAQDKGGAASHHEAASRRQDEADPEDTRKPQDLGDMDAPPLKYSLKRAFKEFLNDQCTDLAAALTYYAVLALFPALVAVVSLLSLVGQAQSTIDTVMGVVERVAPGTAIDTIRPVVENMANAPGAGLALVLGLAGALWSASGYVTAFSRAMNRVLEIGEGRPFWKLRPVMILITLIALILVVVAALILVLSGPLASAVGNQIGLGSTAVTVWRFVKWPVLAGIIVVIIAILYFATPNVKQPKFRWMSTGALTAIVVWLIASVAFAFYVGNFGSYNKTYGSLAGVIVFLLWLWITNLALLFGAEVDSEVERGRELQAGMVAEDELQLPPRDTSKLDKQATKEEADREQAQEIRRSRS